MDARVARRLEEARRAGAGVGAAARLAAWWKPKAATLLGVLYAAVLITGLPFVPALRLLPPAILTILGIGAFGHLVNDWYDIEADARAGKPNRLAALPPVHRRGLLLGALAAALLPWAALPADAASIALLATEFALLLGYAVPPLRLKTRPAWAVVADSAYACAVPAVLATHTVFLAAGWRSDRLVLALIGLYQLALGGRHFLNHLALDRLHDRATGTPTLATERGNRALHGLIRRVVLPVEILALAAFVAVLGRAQPWLVPVMLGLSLVPLSLHLVLAVGRQYPLVTYRFSRNALDRLHQDVLPLVVLAFLTGSDWRFGAILLAHAALFYRRPIVDLAVWEVVRWRLSVLAPSRATPAAAPDLPTAALPLPAGPAPRPEITAGAGPADAAARVNAAPRRVPLTIAVVNINRGKYTETFVDEAIPTLKYRVRQLHGGELPRFDDDGRHFLSRLPALRAVAEAAAAVSGLDRDHFLRHSIASYLQAQDVRLVLAHFGPVGVEMLPIARDLGIPLIVCFHAYDVFHAETLRRHGARYQDLFREAAWIVAVSEHMRERLRALGAPAARLVHLPASVNLGLFPYVDHSARPPRFLAVGRFAETKSPHLTLLAFARVVREVPGATLTLVGKGGGGELFEACVILARALGLERHVVFKGVLSHAEVADEMRQARVFVQHSVTTPEHGDREGKPVAIMEAMACGLPVVATRHSAIPELIDDGITGALVDELDVEAMAGAMIGLARDDERVRRIGAAASAAMHGHPLIAHYRERLEDLIDRAIAER